MPLRHQYKLLAYKPPRPRLEPFYIAMLPVYAGAWRWRQRSNSARRGDAAVVFRHHRLRRCHRCVGVQGPNQSGAGGVREVCGHAGASWALRALATACAGLPWAMPAMQAGGMRRKCPEWHQVHGNALSGTKCIWVAPSASEWHQVHGNLV